MIDEATQWGRFAALLPPVPAQEFMDCRQIGEQEAGLDLLVVSLLEHQIAISETMRAEIAVACEDWGMWTTLAPAVRRCRGTHDSDSADDASLRLIEDADTAPLPGTSIGADDASTGLLVVPWIACDLCGHTLGRAHHREPWGDLSPLAQGYVLFFPGRTTSTTMFAPESAWNALNALRLSCDRTTTPARPVP
ncbi:hypothetical protein ACWDYJ_27765 [Streptomyces sp. NPDC003042]